MTAIVISVPSSTGLNLQTQKIQHQENAWSLTAIMVHAFYYRSSEYLSQHTACFSANPEDLVSRSGDQQMFGGGRRKADLQC